MLKQLTLAASLALMSSLSTASLPEYFDKLSIPILIDILDQAGLETEARTMDSGRQILPLRLEGRFSVLLLYGCDDAQCPEISSIQAMAWEDMDKAASQGANRQRLLEHINAFNAQYPFGRSYLHPDGRVILEMDMSTSNGLSSGRLGSFLGGLAGIQEAFEEHMAAFEMSSKVPSKPLTPPEPVAPLPPSTPPTPVTPPTPIPPPMADTEGDKSNERFLTLRITEAKDASDGCLISGEIENQGKDSYAFISASYFVNIPSAPERYEYLGINAGRGFVHGRKDAHLGPGMTGGNTVLVQGIDCAQISQLEFQDIPFCGDGPPFLSDCTDSTLLQNNGPIPIIDKPDRVVGEPVPVVP